MEAVDTSPCFQQGSVPMFLHEMPISSYVYYPTLLIISTLKERGFIIQNGELK